MYLFLYELGDAEENVLADTSYFEDCLDGVSDLSAPAKLSLSCAVSLGKSSSVSLAFPAAIFFSSSPGAPRLRAAAQAAMGSATRYDCMELHRGEASAKSTGSKKRPHETRYDFETFA